MDNKILSKKEFKKLEHLNVMQIIEHYPELVKKVLLNATSMADAMLNLGLGRTNTRARINLKTFAVSNGVSIPKYDNRNSHFVANKLTKEDVLKRLIKSDKHVGSVLRKWIIQFNIIPYECATKDCIFKEPFYLGKEFNFDLDHINGNNTDNRIENLRFLCPICHSQTETYRGRNAKAYINISVRYCTGCNEPTKLPHYCRECLKDPHIAAKVKQDTIVPSIKDIIEEVGRTNVNYVSNKYCISRETVRKIIKNPEMYNDGYPSTESRNKFTSEAEVIELMNSGMSLPEIAAIKGYTISKFYRKLNKKGYDLPEKDSKTICDCGNEKDARRIACVECMPEVSFNKTKITYPPVEELVSMLDKGSFESVSRELGVSSNAIRKYLRYRGITMQARRGVNGSAYNLCECGKQKRSSSIACAECAKNSVRKLSPADLPHVVESIKRNGISKTANLYKTNRSVVYRFLERNNVNYKDIKID